MILTGGDDDADSADLLRERFVDRYTVVTYDRRGLSRSTIGRSSEASTLTTHSTDAHQPLAALVEFPGGHISWRPRPTEFAAKLCEILG